MRLIGDGPEGREVVRFDRSGRDVYRVPDELLQAKGDRDYYRATMAAPQGTRLSFPIDLNREYARLERPYVPRCVYPPRFTPLGERAGIVVINADMRQVFSDLLATADSGRTLVLARGDGEVLVHPDSALTFRFELGSKKLDDVLPRPTDDAADEEVLVGYQDFTLGPSNDRYVLALTQPMTGLLGAFQQKRNMFIGVFAAIAFGAIILIILFALGVHWQQPAHRPHGAICGRVTRSIARGPARRVRADDTRLAHDAGADRCAREGTGVRAFCGRQATVSGKTCWRT